MKVADMAVEELAALIHRIVAEELDAFRDQDERELRAEFAAELEASLNSGDKGVPLAEVVRELGIKVSATR